MRLNKLQQLGTQVGPELQQRQAMRACVRPYRACVGVYVCAPVRQHVCRARSFAQRCMCARARAHERTSVRAHERASVRFLDYACVCKSASMHA
jgi:hypothetical protein